MTIIHNTTPIREQTIIEIIRAVKPDNIPDVNTLTLRNKQEGNNQDAPAVHGNWGYFYGDSYSITLCVPRLINELKGTRLYTKKPYIFIDEYDFLATVIGHEYYHAWQWINEKDLFHCRGYIEVCAEKYEPIALAKWLEHKKTIDKSLLKPVVSVKYSQFKAAMRTK